MAHHKVNKMLAASAYRRSVLGKWTTKPVILEVYTDASCAKYATTAAFSVYDHMSGKMIHRSYNTNTDFHEKYQVVQVEMLAIKNALEYVVQNYPVNNIKVLLYTDSIIALQYINADGFYIPRHKKAECVKLAEEINNLSVDVDYQHVKGHVKFRKLTPVEVKHHEVDILARSRNRRYYKTWIKNSLPVQEEPYQIFNPVESLFKLVNIATDIY